MLIRTNYSDHTLKKTISACVLAQKQTSKSFNLEQAKKYCEKEIKKSIKSSKWNSIRKFILLMKYKKIEQKEFKLLKIHLF